MADLRHLVSRHFVFEDQQPARTDVDIGIRVNEVHTIDGRRSALVELTGNILHRQIPLAAEVQVLRHDIRHPLAKDAVFALLQQVLAESEQVVHAKIAHPADVQLQVLVQLATQALRLHTKPFSFLYKKPIVHIRLL